MPTITAATSFRRPATTTPSSAGASRSSQPMSAEPKIGCWRLGSGIPAAWGRGTSRAWSSRPAPVGPPDEHDVEGRETDEADRIDHAGATIATAEAAARQASAISATACRVLHEAARRATLRTRARPRPAARATSGAPLEDPAGRSEHRRPEGREQRERVRRRCGTTSMIKTPAPSSAAGTATHSQLRPRARAWRAGAATVAA